MAGKKEKNDQPELLISAYDKMISAVRGVERKGATMPYTSLQGNMFSYIDKSGFLALRLDPVRREEFMGKFNAELAVSNGVVMKEYVRVPEMLLKDSKSLITWFVHSYKYVQTLKPKQSRK